MHRRLVLTVLLTSTLVLLVFVALSLQWRMEHDVPIFVYLSWLIDTQGFVPYRDIFDLNLPGTYAVHIIIGHVFGYTDVGTRVADLLLLATLSGVTLAILRPFSVRCGWFAVLAFGFWYLRHGPTMALQRDYLALLPISGAILATLSERSTPARRAMAMGFLLGLATTIKPYALIGWPWSVIWLAYEARTTAPTGSGFPRALLRVGLAAAVGLVVPLLIAVAYLVAVGAWPAFLDILVNYWPLYGAIDGQQRVLPVAERGAALLVAFRNNVLLPNSWRLDLAVIGCGLALLPRVGLSTTSRRRVVALAGLTLMYGLYPLAGGKVWEYHTLPLVYTSLLAGSLCLIPVPWNAFGGSGATHRLRARTTWLASHGPELVAIAFLAFEAYPSPLLVDQLQGKALRPPKGGTPDAIAAYLSAHLQPGDRVQPLDWAGGAVHGLLETHAVLATPYVYDVQFYHALSTPYIQGLRADFLARVAAQPPRFVVEIPGKGRVSGVDTSEEFLALDDWLRRGYIPVVDAPRYRLYERRSSGP